jgi:hypothetical protein
MNKNIKFPIRFFLVTFIFSWVLWTPHVLGSLTIIPISEKLLSGVRFPVIMLGAFGPLAGALYDLGKREGKGSAKRYLQSFLDFRSGEKLTFFR